jgi:large subunit ribosomal protein L29
MSKATEFRELPADSLAAKVKEMESQLFTSRLQAGLGKLENTSSLRTLRKGIARARTVLKEKESKAA